MVRVVPLSQAATSVCAASERVFYEVLPARPLPTLDLSISLASRFLSRPALDWLHRFVRKRNLIIGTWIVAVTLLSATPLVPASTGHAVGILTAVLWLPAVVASFTLLRYDVVCLLLQSYDFWFCTLVVTATSTVYGALLGDARAASLLAGWAGLQINTMIDANIRAVKIWVVLTVFAGLFNLESWVVISLGVLDDPHDFSIVKFPSHELRASKFVSSGLLTTFAILARNLYRKRAVLQKAANTSIIECASFRVNLQLFEVPSRAAVPNVCLLEPVIASKVKDGSGPEYTKTMQYIKQVDEIDSHNTMLPQPATRVFAAVFPRFSAAFQWIGVISAAFSVLDALADTFLRQSDDTGSFAIDIVALASTALYTLIYLAHYQRELVRALLTSFDFLFLYTQLALAHVFVCDFFRWRSRCVTRTLTSWLWVQWVLCLDAVTPADRRKLGLQKRFVVWILVLFFGSSSGVVCSLLLAAESSVPEIYDRVILARHTLGIGMELRVAPLFFSCCSNVVAMLLRLLWRAIANASDVLLVLDGLVVYENYLRTAKDRYSRRWGSVAVKRNFVKRISLRAVQHVRPTG